MSDAIYGSRLPSQQQLADDMLAFLEATPLAPDLLCTKHKGFLFHFEACRMLIVREMLLDAGFKPDSAFRMLDFGFLHGLTQEFTHRFFPNAFITVCDNPLSSNFSDSNYLEAIKKRSYLKLIARGIEDVDEPPASHDVIFLGEIIEHLDPTRVAAALAKLCKMIQPGGLMIITTPNGAGLYNNVMIMLGHDLILHPVIPNPVTGYGHIHLWPMEQLRATAEHNGWKFKAGRYYHGRDAEKFDEVQAHWGSLKHQILLRGIKFLANRYPKLRGFYVASFTPER